MPSSLLPLRSGLATPNGHARWAAAPLLNDVVRSEQKGRRDRETERLGGFHVDHQLELRGLLHRKIARLGAFEDFGHISGGPPELVSNVRPIGHEAPGLRELPLP